MTRPTSARARQATEPVGPVQAARGRLVPVLAGLLVIGVLVVIVVLWRNQGGTDGEQAGVAAGKAVVGGDLHAIAVSGNRLFVSGHEGAAYSDGSDTWTAVPGLEGKDGMAWAASQGRLLVGGHEGLYVSTDNGASFSPAEVDLPISDVHALGGAGQTVYLASPQAGTFVSTDGGRTFSLRSRIGQSFMGSILVDPDNPDRAIAPDMMAGVAETVDGGRTWRSLGGPQGAMSVGWDPADHAQMVAVGTDVVMLTTDAGRSWLRIDAPAGTVAATFDSKGRLVSAALIGDRARVQHSADSGKTWLAN